MATPSRIFYDDDVTGNFEIYSCGPDGTNVVQITNDPTYDSHWPQVKPDGTKLMFVRVPAGTGTGAASYLAAQYWTCTLTGGSVTKVYDNPVTQGWTAQGTPHWHPTLDEVCHFVKSAGAYTIRTLTASANPFVAASTRTTAGTGANAVQVDPSYSADGTQILFSDYRQDTTGTYAGSIRVVDRTGAADANLATKMIQYACGAASTGNLVLSAAQTVDGVALIAGNCVLVKDQTNPAENGLYTVAAGAWARNATYANTGLKHVGLHVWIYSGTVNANKMFQCATDSAPTLGTTAITFTDVTSTGRIAYATGGTVQYPNDPRQSPDGTKIAYLQKVDASHAGIGNWDVKYILTAQSRPTTVIGDDNINSRPEWLTNEWILFHRLRWASDSHFGSWRIHVTGGSLAPFVARGEYPCAPSIGALPNVALSTSSRHVQDLKVKQLTDWQALSPSTRKGSGAGLEWQFWRELGWQEIPWGDMRKMAQEAYKGSALTATTNADREFEFWKN